MRRIGSAVCLTAVAAVLVAVPAVAPGKAETSGTGGARKAERLRDLERARLKAFVDADVATGRPLHASDFELINPAGDVLTRDDMLGAVGAGVLDFQVYEPVSRIKLRLYGNRAVMRDKSNIDVVLADVGRLTHRAWHTVL